MISKLLCRMQLARDRGEPITLPPEDLVALIHYMSLPDAMAEDEDERQRRVNESAALRAALGAAEEEEIDAVSPSPADAELKESQESLDSAKANAPGVQAHASRGSKGCAICHGTLVVLGDNGCRNCAEVGLDVEPDVTDPGSTDETAEPVEEWRAHRKWSDAWELWRDGAYTGFYYSYNQYCDQPFQAGENSDPKMRVFGSRSAAKAHVRKLADGTDGVDVTDRARRVRSAAVKLVDHAEGCDDCGPNRLCGDGRALMQIAWAAFLYLRRRQFPKGGARPRRAPDVTNLGVPRPTDPGHCDGSH